MPKPDRALIYLRAENARISLKQLSRHLNKSPQRIKYNLSVLEKNGILSKPYAVFDYASFGLLMFKVYFRGAYIKEKERARIVAELEENPYILSIYELTGEYDLMLVFGTTNPSKFSTELKNLIARIPTLKDYTIVLNVVSYKYPKHYLLEGTGINPLDPEIILGGDKEKDALSPKDMLVIKYLVSHPMARFTRLAEKTGLNVKTVKSIIRDLKKRKILKGFKYVIDITKLDTHRWRLFLNLHNLSSERETKFMAHLHRSSGVVQTNKTVGDWDLEVDIESLEKNTIRHIVSEIKEEFADIIEHFSLIEIYRYDKISYLPRYLFES